MEDLITNHSCNGEAANHQPALDVSTKRMLSRSNLLSVRELVKARQEERSAPVGDLYIQRMEDTLMRWKPPVSSHQGTTMALEGEHPFQAPTAKPRGREESSTFRDKALAYRTLNLFWRKKTRSPSCEDINDDFSFDLSADEPATNVTFAEAAETVVRTPFGIPASLPETSKEDREIILQNEEEIYQQYYRNAIPEDYLAMAHNGELQNQQAKSFWFPNSIKSCLPLCACVAWI